MTLHCGIYMYWQVQIIKLHHRKMNSIRAFVFVSQWLRFQRLEQYTGLRAVRLKLGYVDIHFNNFFFTLTVFRMDWHHSILQQWTGTTNAVAHSSSTMVQMSTSAMLWAACIRKWCVYSIAALHWFTPSWSTSYYTFHCRVYQFCGQNCQDNQCYTANARKGLIGNQTPIERKRVRMQAITSLWARSMAANNFKNHTCHRVHRHNAYNLGSSFTIQWNRWPKWYNVAADHSESSAVQRTAAYACSRIGAEKFAQTSDPTRYACTRTHARTHVQTRKHTHTSSLSLSHTDTHTHTRAHHHTTPHPCSLGPNITLKIFSCLCLGPKAGR